MHYLARSSKLRTIEVSCAKDLKRVDFDARNNADHAALDILGHREEVNTTVRRAFEKLMAIFNEKSSELEYFDAEDIVPKLD